jgi:lysophospholipase L1-like esterase
VASIGDSYASGEGVPNEPGALSEASAVPGWPSDAKRCEDWTTHQMIFNPTYTMDTPVQWLEERAHRSNRSAAYKAAWDLAAEGRRVTLTTFASSGAEVSAGLLLKQHTWQPSGQLDQLRKAVGTNRIDALLISIGGNDVGFADALTWLTAPGGLSGGKSAAAVRAVVEPKIEDVSTRLDAVNAQIKGLGLNVGTVYLVEYPESHFELPTMDPVTGKLKTQACGVFDTSLAGFGRLFGANPADRELTHDLAAKLNRALRDKATALGWQVVGGIADGFRGHGYCAPEPYFVGASRSCAAQGNFDGTMHPNEKGINVQRARIRATLASKLAI